MASKESSSELEFSTITGEQIRNLKYLDMHRYIDHTFKDLMPPEELYKLKKINLNGIDYLEGTWTEFWTNRLGLGYVSSRTATRDVCRLLNIEDEVPNRLDQTNSLITMSRVQKIPPYIESLVGIAKEFTQKLQEAGANPPLAVLNNPATLTTLPFPRIGIRILPEDPESVFNLSTRGDLLHYFTFHGRHISRTIRYAVNKLSSGPGGRGRKAGVWIFGTEGFGKSMELAKLAISLIATRCRVIYIPSSRECAANPVSYLIPAFILAYGHDPKLVEEIARFQSKENISKFVKERANSNDYIHFLIDGYGDLETNARGSNNRVNGLDRTTKAVTQEWLICISAPPHYRVLCSSSNQLSAHEMLNKPGSSDYIQIHCKGGYLRQEIDAWWNRIPEDSSGLKKKDREMMDIITGNVPSLLKLLSKPNSGGDHWKNLRLIADGAHYFSSGLLRDRTASEFGLHQKFVKGCILQRSVVSRIAHDLVDHRYFYRQADGTGRCTNLVVSDTMFRWLEEQQPGLFKPEDFRDMARNAASLNSTVFRFAIEAASITSISSTGLPIAKELEGVKKGVPIPMKLFLGKYPNMFTDDAGATLHCPSSFNHPHIDAIICSREPRNSINVKPKTRLVTLLPIQISLDSGTTYISDSETRFFHKFSKWKYGSWTLEWRFEFIFIWIGGKAVGQVETVTKNWLGFDHPEYTRITIPFDRLLLNHNIQVASTPMDPTVEPGEKRKLEEAFTWSIKRRTKKLRGG